MKAEFIEGIIKLGFDRAPAAEIFSHLDLDQDGWIDYGEFAVFTRDPHHDELDRKLRGQFSKLQITGHRMRQVFKVLSHLSPLSSCSVVFYNV